MPSRTFSLSSAAVIFAIASFQGSGDSVAAGPVSATCSGGSLRASIPYRASHPGAGLLTVDVLNPEDEAVARSERRTTVSARTGSWRDELRFAKPLPTDELVWHRLRYGFTCDDAGIAPIHGVESISEILRLPMLRIIGQQTWLSGAPAAVRVILSDSRNDPIAGAGSVKASLRTPDGLTGTFPVEYIAETRLGSAEDTQQVRLEDQVSTRLTTEKTLTLNRASHEAVAARKLTFELED